MDKFIADSDYGDSDQKSNSEGSYLSNSYGGGSSINSYKGEVLKLQDISIQKFTDELKTSLNKKAPMFLWSKRRQNEKILLDNEKQVLILNKIQNLRAIGDELVHLKAGAIFDEEYIQLLVADKRMLAQQYFEKTIASHRLFLTETKSAIDLANERIKHDFIDQQTKIKQYESIDADNAIKLAQAESIKIQNELRRIVMKKVDFENFPPVYTTYLLAVLSGVNAEAFTDLDIKEKLKEVYIDMEKSKADKARAEVDDFINSAEFKKWKNDRTKKDAGL